jgi:hypothetical protein
MYRFQLIVFGLLLTVNAFSQVENTSMVGDIISMKQFQETGSYKSITGQLQSEYRLCTANAASIKMVSSNSFVAFEQTHDSIIKQHGKIEVNDIELVLKANDEKQISYIIITSYMGFAHAFQYDELNGKLQRFKSAASIILPNEEPLQVKECTGSEVFLFVKSGQWAADKWIRYYTLDLKNNVFSNTRNCGIVDGEEVCKKIEPNEIISLRSSKSCPMPPFAKLIAEITAGGISIRSELPPREKMNESHLAAYDLWDTIPKYRQIDKADYDAIIDFVLYSGLLSINPNYKGYYANGIEMRIQGACSYGYTIKTKHGEISLPIFGGIDYDVPGVVSEFSGKYHAILEKYFAEKDYEPDFYLHIHLRHK